MAAGDRPRGPAAGSAEDAAAGPGAPQRDGDAAGRAAGADDAARRAGRAPRQGRRAEAAGTAVAAGRVRSRDAAAPSRRCRRARCPSTSSPSCWRSSVGRWKSARTSSASSRRCSSRTRPTASSCRRWRRSSTAGSRRTSATGSIRSPGLQTFHEGIDFPAETGTTIVAAASGKVVEAGFHPQYGKILAIDHGNGLVSRYAHASQVFVQRRRPRRARPAGGDGGFDRPLDRPAPAFRGPAERRAAESRALPAIRELIRGDRRAGQCRRNEG